MIQYREFTKKTRLDVGVYDRFFSTFKDYEEDLGLRVPPIGSHWSIVFVDLKYKDYESLSKHEFPSFIEVEVFLRKELLIETGIQKNIDLSSQFNDFLQNMIAGFPKQIEDKAVREIWKRCGGDDTQIQSVLTALTELDVPKITVKDLNAVIAPSQTVWASEVVLSMFVYYNEHVPKKGSPLSAYKWKSPFVLLTNHRNILGTEYSFYSIRKSIAKLYDLKVALLKGEVPKSAKKNELKLMEVVDVYSLLYATLLFKQSSPLSLQSVVMDIVHRQAGFERKVALLHDSLYQGQIH